MPQVATSFRRTCVFLIGAALAVLNQTAMAAPDRATVAPSVMAVVAAEGAAGDLIIAARRDATLGQVVAKVFDRAGRVVGLLNGHGHRSAKVILSDRALQRGRRVEVKIQVFPNDGRPAAVHAFADVVVARAPRLTLTAANAPTSLFKGHARTFSYTVGESGGDLGASAHLTLTDGAAVVAQTDVTIPAGGSVTASLVASFETLGRHNLTAAVVLTSPLELATGKYAQRVERTSAVDVVPAEVTTTLDSTGGKVTLEGGPTLTIPAGALDQPTNIQIVVTDAPGPVGVTPLSAVYRFLPEGLLFARPVTVTLPLSPGVNAASVYWSRLGASGFDPIGGSVAGGLITAQTAHFSLGVAGPPSSTRTVTGVGQTTWISATTRVSQPIDFSADVIEALVMDPTTGDVTAYPGTAGTGVAAGTFTIPNVPVGEYILHWRTHYIVTSSNTPDLGNLRGGRPPAERTPLTSATMLSLSVTNLEPWAPTTNGFLEFFSTETNMWDFGTDQYGTLPAGATSTSLSFDLRNVTTVRSGSNPGGSEIHGSAGDSAYLGQLAARTSSNGTPYLAMTRLAALPSFDLVSGATISVTATMSDVSAVKTISYDYRGSLFREAVAAGNPQQGSFSGSTFVFGQPGSAEDGFYSSNADLLWLPELGASDVVTGTMTYGSPANAGLAGDWGELFWVSAVASGGERNEWLTSVASAQAGPIVPKASVPTGITLDGLPFYSGGAIGATATLAWTRGPIGVPTFYRVALAEVVANGSGRPTFLGVGSFTTTSTTLRFPPNILLAGHSYIVGITAVVPTSPDAATLLATAPLKSGIDIARALTTSAVFTR